MMPPIILTMLQGLFLLLLYVFVARAVRAVIRDVNVTAVRARRAPAPQPAQHTPHQPSDQQVIRPQSDRRGEPNGEADHGPSREERPPPREIVVHSPTGAPRVMALDGEEITFGRGERTSVPLKDPYTSDRHARIYRDGGRWLVADLGSTNGTFLNQVKVIEPTPIAAGDQLGIGRTVVEVRK